MERVFMKTSSLHLQKPVRNKLFQFILRLRQRQIKFKIVMNANATKIPWSAEDDAVPTNLVAQRSSGLSWVDIGRRLQRSHKICRNRWIYALDPSIKREAWSTEEDAALRKLYVQFNGSFGKIARHLPGRSDNVCRNRFCCIEPQQARAANLLNRRCVHNAPARRCKKCNGSDICEHRVTRNWCVVCKGPLLIRLQIKNQLALVSGTSVYENVLAALAKARAQ